MQLPAGPALVCEPLEPFSRHFFTTRHWKLGTRTEAETGWTQIAEAAGVSRRFLNHLRQIHGTGAVILRKTAEADAGSARREDAHEDADIVLTDDPTLAIAVKAADCLPILIADREAPVVAAAHAGWRGLASRAPVVALEKLVSEFGSSRHNLLAAIGPAIGACCYEVGDEVRARFDAFAAADVARWFAERPAAWAANPPMPSLLPTPRSGHWFFNPWQCARDQLVSAGIPSNQIFVAELCTASHPDVFCSYRCEGARAGRMVGLIRTRYRLSGAETASPESMRSENL